MKRNYLENDGHPDNQKEASAVAARINTETDCMIFIKGEK